MRGRLPLACLTEAASCQLRVRGEPEAILEKPSIVDNSHFDYRVFIGYTIYILQINL